MNYKSLPMGLIRMMLAAIMMVHAVARIYLDGVDDFGIFLEQSGFPVGLLLAWAITVFEFVGSVLLILKYWVRYTSIYFSFQLLIGIFLVHLKEGWFVVGAGRNGAEYSVVLIICFIAIAMGQKS